MYLRPGQKWGIEALTEEYGITMEQHHRAKDDAMATQSIIKHLLKPVTNDPLGYLIHFYHWEEVYVLIIESSRNIKLKW